jgi:hypothetical protein
MNKIDCYQAIPDLEIDAAELFAVLEEDSRG